MFNRQLGATIIENALHFPTTAILGPRQVGKTTLAKNLMLHLNKEAIYLDLELPRDLAQLENAELLFENNQDKCIILDEIQYRPDLFPLMRALIDRHRVPGRFILTGSAAPELINQSAESLAGRIIYENLLPLNLTEVLPDYTQQMHWQRGGFPEALQLKTDDLRQKWANNFIKTYLERDLPALGLNTSTTHLYRFWGMIAHTNGNIFNASNFARALQVSSNTINRYTGFLADSFIIRLLQPYFTNGKKRLVKSPKVYIRDSGLLHALLNLPSFDRLQLNPAIGGSWEGYVIEQICQLLPERTNAFYYRTQAGAECDLVLENESGTKVAIEIKYSLTPNTSRGFTSALEDLQPNASYIIIPAAERSYELKSGVKVIGLTDFIQNEIKKLF